MLAAIFSVLKAVTAAAVVIPGVDALTESVGQSVGLDLDASGALVGLDKVAEGSKSIAGVVKGIHDFNQGAADLSATIGNTIGVDHLSGLGEDKLTAASFTEDFGIIPKVFSNVAAGAPDTMNTLFSEGNRNVVVPAAIGGATVGAVALSASPRDSQELRIAVGRAAQTSGNMLKTAAQTTANVLGGTVEASARIGGGLAQVAGGTLNLASQAGSAVLKTGGEVGKHLFPKEQAANQAMPTQGRVGQRSQPVIGEHTGKLNSARQQQLATAQEHSV